MWYATPLSANNVTREIPGTVQGAVTKSKKRPSEFVTAPTAVLSGMGCAPAKRAAVARADAAPGKTGTDRVPAAREETDDDMPTARILIVEESVSSLTEPLAQEVLKGVPQ